MAVCTIFKNFSIPVENVSLIILSNWIASDKYKTAVAEIRDLIAQAKQKKHRQRNNSFQPSHLRQHSKKKDCCQTWSNTVDLFILILIS